MTPIVFGPPARRLVGLYHPPADGSTAPTAVLLCNPYGHEAIRIHRLYRVLADRLARGGQAVLRFDYFGTGDSPGDDEDGDLESWRVDLGAAHQELLRRSGAAEVRWAAARLGACVALRAAQPAPAGLQRLVLWDPIVDGRAYARLLRVKHVEALELSYCIPDPAWRRALDVAPDDAPREAIGFALSPRFGAQMLALNDSVLTLPPQVDTRVILQSADVTVARWLDRHAGSATALRPQVLDHGLLWTSDPQPNDAVVPTEALQRLLGELT